MGRIRTLLTNLAQILLLFPIVPIALLICEKITPASSISNLISFIGQVPLSGILADILSQYTSAITSTDIADITLWVFFKEFPTAIIAGISVHFCISIFDFIWAPIKSKYKSFRPLPILPGFLGVFISSLITGAIGLTQNVYTEFAIEMVVILIALFGIKLMFSSLFPKKIISFTKILIWIIDGLFAVIISIYVASLILLLEGNLSDPARAIGACLIIAGVTIIASVLVYFVRLSEQ